MNFVPSSVWVEKEVAVAIIKPDALQAGLADQIIEEVKFSSLTFIWHNFIDFAEIFSFIIVPFLVYYYMHYNLLIEVNLIAW